MRLLWAIRYQIWQSSWIMALELLLSLWSVWQNLMWINIFMSVCMCMHVGLLFFFLLLNFYFLIFLLLTQRGLKAPCVQRTGSLKGDRLTPLQNDWAQTLNLEGLRVEPFRGHTSFTSRKIKLKWWVCSEAMWCLNPCDSGYGGIQVQTSHVRMTVIQNDAVTDIS